MQPETWMREPKFTRVRKKHLIWTKEHFLSLAQSLFGTPDLDLKQLDELVAALKQPGVQPPGGIVQRDPVVVTKLNPTHYTGTDKSRLYLNRDRVGIQFDSMATAMDWAYRLMVRTGMPFEKAKARWQEGMTLNYFHQIWSEGRNIPGLTGLKLGHFELDPQLLVTLKKLSSTWRRATTPYPDHTPIKRQYNSLSMGDSLVDAKGKLWTVEHVKPKLSGPPEITLASVEETSDAVPAL